MVYNVYYKNNKGNYIIYDGKDIKEKNEELTDPHFELIKSLDKTNDNLKQYHKDIKVWAEQIRDTFMTDIKPNYLEAFTDILASVRFINFMCFKNYKYHEIISTTEALYIDKPYNGGLMYVKPTTKAHKCYSNDKNNFYSEVMGNPQYEFYIPDKDGYETKIKDIGVNLKYGYYHMKIEPKTEQAYKIFSFNSDNWYNFYCVKFVLENKDYFNYELIMDCDVNAYLYNSVVKSSDIFGGWLKKLTYLKSRFPDNKLVKNLSRAWGGLSMKTCIKVNENIILKNPEKYENYEIIDTIVNEESIIHKLKTKDNKTYKHNIRLKSWINSFCRCEIAKTILKNIDCVVRVQTDSITYNKDIEPDKTEKKELKTTGYIRFSTVNNYHHKCKQCKEYFKYKDFHNHKC